MNNLKFISVICVFALWHNFQTLIKTFWLFRVTFPHSSHQTFVVIVRVEIEILISSDSQKTYFALFWTNTNSKTCISCYAGTFPFIKSIRLPKRNHNIMRSIEKNIWKSKKCRTFEADGYTQPNNAQKWKIFSIKNTEKFPSAKFLCLCVISFQLLYWTFKSCFVYIQSLTDTHTYIAIGNINFRCIHKCVCVCFWGSWALKTR